MGSLARYFTMLLIGGVLLAALPWHSFAQTSPVVSARKIRDFGRISFEWPRETRLQAASNGTQLRLTFEQAAKIDPSPILRGLAPYITKAQQSGDGRSLTLTLNDAYQIRSFVSGTLSGVDILRLKETPAVVSKPEPKPAPKAEPKPQPKPVFAALPKPEVKPTAAVVSKPEVEKPVAPKIVEAAKEPEKPIAEKKEEKTEEKKEAIAEEAPPAPPAPSNPPIPQSSNHPIILTAEATENALTFHLPFTERTAAVAFRRGKVDYFYFSSAAAIEIEALKAASQVKNAVLQPLAKGVMLMVETDLPGIEAQKSESPYALTFALSAVETPPLKPIRSLPQTQPPLKPHLLLPVLELSAPLPFVDPVAGDMLTLVPSYQMGSGVVPGREFVEFALLPTAQGIVVQPKAENLRVAQLRNGMKITAPDGITLSTDLPPLASNNLIADVEGSSTIFPYELWRTPADREDSYHFAAEIMREIPSSPSVQKNALRLRLAQLYLAEERPMDALALLELIRREAPAFYDQQRLSALRGAANFLVYRYNEAWTDFSDEALNDIAEIELWRDTLGIILSGDGKANYLEYYKNFLSKYPPYMATRLALAAADLLIERQQFNQALKIFDTLNKAQMLQSVKDFVDYQIARISAASGQKQVAEKIWGKLAASPDNFIRSRAQFALTNFLLREARIDIPTAIRQLEPLRIVWRGDDFELGLLQFIGDLYEATNQPREALRAYREVVQYFPEYPGNTELLAKMSDMFVALFNGGMADKMEPLEALALYYEFRELTPVEEAGDRMVRNLADRLVKVDLLDRAAALLEHQVRFRLAGEERSRTGAQLALVHLLNRKPKQALTALETTGYGQNPDDLQHHRTLLTARSLADLGETPRALGLLQGDDTPDAARLRLSLHWDKKDWKNVIASAEGMMGQRTDPAAAITDAESDTLLKLALAYVFERQSEQLQYLRDYFLPLMKGNKNAHLFEFVTKDAPVDYRNLAQLTRHINTVEQFLATYREKMAKEGLSKAIP